MEAAPQSAETVENLRWHDVCKVLEYLFDLARIKIPAKNKYQLRESKLFPARFRRAVARGETLYPLIRLVIPHSDHMHRAKYNMQARTRCRAGRTHCCVVAARVWRPAVGRHSCTRLASALPPAADLVHREGVREVVRAAPRVHARQDP